MDVFTGWAGLDTFLYEWVLRSQRGSKRLNAMDKKLFLGAIFALAVLTPEMASAYIGPGAGAGAIAAVLGVIGSVFLAIVGVVFLCVWIYIVYIKREVERRIARGKLPGQRPV